MMLSIMDPHSAQGIAVRILHEWTDLLYQADEECYDYSHSID